MRGRGFDWRNLGTNCRAAFVCVIATPRAYSAPPSPPVGLCLGSAVVTRFIVLSTQRSGSTWVVDMLSSHPRVVAYSELFMHGGEGTPSWGPVQDLPYWQTYIREQRGGRLARPVQLWRYLGRAFEERPGVDAVGFKLMYSQLIIIAKPLMPALWLKRVRIVHLMRRNALDVVLSKEAGQARRGVLHAREGQPVEAVRVKRS